MDIKKIKNANTKLLGKNIIYYDEIGSTQDEAKKLIKSGLENGTIFLANSQVKGRGTKERIWYSSKGNNITMTMVLFPKCNVNKIQNLTKIALYGRDGLCGLLVNSELYGYKLKIKIPNDLLLNGKKICGILTESSTSNGILNHILIGIGFNVNEEVFNEETVNIATSLKKEYHKNFSREEIIIKFIEIFEKKIEFMM